MIIYKTEHAPTHLLIKELLQRHFDYNTVMKMADQKRIMLLKNLGLVFIQDPACTFYYC